MENRSESSSLLTPHALPLTDIGNEVSGLRTETGKLFELDPKLGQGQYGLEARTGPIHYKEAYKDTDPWLDLDESYCEPGEIKGVGKVLIYPKLPNIVTVFQDICGYQIQSRSNPDHIAKVELVSIDGQEVTAWQDSTALKTSVRVHPYRVGIWKDFSAASKAKSTTMRWKVTELGNSAKDSHPFAFRETPEAFSTADTDSLIDRESAKVSIETARTRIDDSSWYWDELIPADAKLVDTDWQVGTGANDGRWYTNYFTNTGNTVSCGKAYTTANHSFMYFTNVSIAKDSTINSCVLKFVSYSNNSSNPIYSRLCFENSDNPSVPSSYGDVTGRQRTSGVDWDFSTAWSSGTEYTSADFKGELNAVTNRQGWSSGNAVVAFWLDDGCGTDKIRYASSYDYNSSYAAKMSVTWTPPTVVGRRPRVYVPNVYWLSKSLQKRREI